MMLLGTFALPLRPLLRQGKPVVKISRELEIVSPGGGSGDDASIYGGLKYTFFLIYSYYSTTTAAMP